MAGRAGSNSRSNFNGEPAERSRRTSARGYRTTLDYGGGDWTAPGHAPDRDTSQSQEPSVEQVSEHEVHADVMASSTASEGSCSAEQREFLTVESYRQQKNGEQKPASDSGWNRNDETTERASRDTQSGDASGMSVTAGGAVASVSSSRSSTEASTPRWLHLSRPPSSAGKSSAEFSEPSGAARERALRRRREWKRLARRREAMEMNLLEEQFNRYCERILSARGFSRSERGAASMLPESIALAELAKRYQRRASTGQRLQGLSPAEIRERRNAQKRESKQRIQRYREERASLLRRFISAFKMELGELDDDNDNDNDEMPTETGEHGRSADSAYGVHRGDLSIASTQERPFSEYAIADAMRSNANHVRQKTRLQAGSRSTAEALQDMSSFIAEYRKDALEDMLFGSRPRSDAANMAIAELDGNLMLNQQLIGDDDTGQQLREANQIVSELLAEMDANGPLVSAWDLSLLKTSGMNTIMVQSPSMGRLLVGMQVFQGLFTSERAARVLGISGTVARNALERLHNNGLLLAIPRTAQLSNEYAYLVPEHVRRIPPHVILQLATERPTHKMVTLVDLDSHSGASESMMIEAKQILYRVEHNFVQELRERLSRLQLESRSDQPDVWDRIRIYFDELKDDFFYAIEVARNHYGIVGVSDFVASFSYPIRYVLKAEARTGIFRDIYERFEPALRSYLTSLNRLGQNLSLWTRDVGTSAGDVVALQRQVEHGPSVADWHRLYPTCLGNEHASDDALSSALLLGGTVTSAAMPSPLAEDAPCDSLTLSFPDEIEHAILSGLCLSRACIDSLDYEEAERILEQLLEVCTRHSPIIIPKSQSASSSAPSSTAVAPLGPRSFFPHQEVHLLMHPTIHVAILENLGRSHALRGRTKAACRCLAQTLALRRQLGQEQSIPYALTLISFGDSLIREHQLETARTVFEEALSIFDRFVHRYAERFELSSRAEALYYLALLHFVAGDESKAIELLNVALEVLDARHSSNFICCSPRTVLTLETMIYKLLAQIYIAAGRRDRALVLLQNALNLIASTYARGIETGIHGGSQSQDERATRDLVDVLSQLSVDAGSNAR